MLRIQGEGKNASGVPLVGLIAGLFLITTVSSNSVVTVVTGCIISEISPSYLVPTSTLPVSTPPMEIMTVVLVLFNTTTCTRRQNQFLLYVPEE